MLKNKKKNNIQVCDFHKRYTLNYEVSDEQICVRHVDGDRRCDTNTRGH